MRCCYCLILEHGKTKPWSSVVVAHFPPKIRNKRAPPLAGFSFIYSGTCTRPPCSLEDCYNDVPAQWCYNKNRLLFMINRFQPPSVEHYGHFFMLSTKDAFLLKKIAVQSIVLVKKRTLKLSLTLTLHWQEQERCSSKVIVSLRSLPRATSTTITWKISNALGFVYEIVTVCPAVLKRLLSKSSASLKGLHLFFPHLSLQDFFLQRLASE